MTNPLEKILHDPVKMTLFTLSVAAGAVVSVVVGFRILTAIVWWVGA
ncbi:MAG: hypothetical protein IT285_04905 [Bdellovibrionales bacterium]|nr:hypothetical protein [Bdellovibrionales bacterium]